MRVINIQPFYKLLSLNITEQLSENADFIDREMKNDNENNITDQGVENGDHNVYFQDFSFKYFMESSIKIGVAIQYVI